MILDARGTLGTAAPFADLTPAGVLDALDAVGMPGDGRMLQLNSYENRVFQAFLEDGQVVVLKFYRPARWSDAQILEEHAFAIELAEHEIPVVPPIALTAATDERHWVHIGGPNATLAEVRTQTRTHRFAIAPRKSGRAPELDDAATLQWIGRFLGRLHAVGAMREFRGRGVLDLATVGFAARDWLRDHDTIPPDAHQPWNAACDAALGEAQRLFDAAGQIRQLRLHGDCHAGNLLWTEAGPHFVDLDDTCTGPAIQDLWMLLSGDEHSMDWQLAQLLSGYEQFMDFDARERLLIEPLRTLRMIHHSAWIARRWRDPAFPVAFPWFEGPAYWHQQAQQLREQFDAMRQLPAP
jgi:Ser/Thr protein kinase RdoA (MazF antagonist)